MKTEYTVIILVSCLNLTCLTTFAQKTDSTFKQITKKDTSKLSQSKDLIRTANDLKSGNWQDVLTSFFQLSLQDIASPNHSFGFKANLFAIKAKTDSTVLIDTNYVRHKFSRNFQFDFSLKFDSVYHFNGFKGGFTWAIVNKRDSSVVHFANDYSKNFYGALIDTLQKFSAAHTHILKDSATGKPILDEQGHAQAAFNSKEDSILWSKTMQTVKAMLDNGFFSTKLLPKEFTNLPLLDSLFRKADSAFQDNLSKLAKQPLMTLSANANFDKINSKLNGGEATYVWLQGFSSTAYGKGEGVSCESDLRFIGSTIDTTLNNSTFRRTIIHGVWGLNVIVIHKSKSILEFKPNFEYSHVYHGLINGENKNGFFANADLRIRVTENLWIPFQLKYDVKRGNFLGFLNVSFNMNAFKSSKS
jgi:hypothetical protein